MEDCLKYQIPTYMGNKRKVLNLISDEVLKIEKKLGRKLNILDGFSGSGVVSRMLKKHSNFLISNDIEKYSETINKCYLTNKSSVNISEITKNVNWLNSRNNRPRDFGHIINNYSPKDDFSRKKDERAFFTHLNALKIDNMLDDILNSKIKDKYLYIGPLLVEASIHNNCSGQFNSFHKKDGIGHWGGKGENALNRIKGEISSRVPIFTPWECKYKVERKDINELVNNISQVDLCYYDPPYNKHHMELIILC